MTQTRPRLQHPDNSCHSPLRHSSKPQAGPDHHPLRLVFVSSLAEETRHLIPSISQQLCKYKGKCISDQFSWIMKSSKVIWRSSINFTAHRWVSWVHLHFLVQAPHLAPVWIYRDWYLCDIKLLVIVSHNDALQVPFFSLFLSRSGPHATHKCILFCFLLDVNWTTLFITAICFYCVYISWPHARSAVQYPIIIWEYGTLHWIVTYLEFCHVPRQYLNFSYLMTTYITT